MRFVAVKSEVQQSVLSPHRVREQLVKMRRMQINRMHGLSSEFGAVVRSGAHGMEHAARRLGELAEALPTMVIDTPRVQSQRIETLSHDIATLERRLAAWRRENEAASRLMAVPGVGPLSATAAIATIGDARTFRWGREFAAFLGLVPRQSGTGGRVSLLGITKRGDGYLRTLLIHGARAVLSHRKSQRAVQRLLARRTFNIAVVALLTGLHARSGRCWFMVERINPVTRSAPRGTSTYYGDWSPIGCTG